MASSPENIFSSEKDEVQEPGPDKQEGLCPYCFGPLAPGSNFCTACGTNLKTGETAEDRARKENAKKQFASFFNNPGSSSNRVDVKLGLNSDRAKIEAIVEAGADDVAGFPEGFAIGIKADVDLMYLVREEDSNGVLLMQHNRKAIKCNNAEFTVGDKKIKFSDICPDEVGLFIGAEQDAVGDNEKTKKQEILLRKMSSPSDFVSLLHEVGHVIDFQKKGPDYAGMLRCAPKPIESMSPEDIETIKITARQERDAWAEALRIAKSRGLPIRKYIKKIAEDCLHTYQEAYNLKDIAFTNKRRGEIRREKNRN